ncbi:MAG: macrocin O-methyltransferase [Bacteroidetes bacterium]|nr:macrocin O-methyltransferase [Bacteroidota bacterium]
MLSIIKFLKDFLLFFPATLLFAPLSKIFIFIGHFNKLINWIQKNKRTVLYSDFYSPIRRYEKRFELYRFLVEHFQLTKEPILYLEFGVATGSSFRWWTDQNKHEGSLFVGFDTFEGLPENWGGIYKKGDMSASTPVLDDIRTRFVKGLFQDTLYDFLEEHDTVLKSSPKKVIHLDADLYSSTAFTLSQLVRYLKTGDLILFDEFTVALHEFKAFSEFTSTFGIKLTPVAAVNNFYQTAFVVD